MNKWKTTNLVRHTLPLLMPGSTNIVPLPQKTAVTYHFDYHAVAFIVIMVKCLEK